MERERESYSNKFNEDKSSEQSRLADLALERGQGLQPGVGSGATPQSEVVSERASAAAPIPTSDATLNFGARNAITSGWIPEIPYDAAHRSMAGGVGGERLTSSPPDHFGAPLTPVPLCTESRSSAHMNTEQVLRGGK